MKTATHVTTVTSHTALTLVALLVSTVLGGCTPDVPVEPEAEGVRDYVLTPEERKMDLSSVDTTALGDIGELLRVAPQAEGPEGVPGIEQAYTPMETTAILYLAVVWLYQNGVLVPDAAVSLMVPVVWANVALQYDDGELAVRSFEIFIERTQKLVEDGMLDPDVGQSLIDLAQEAIDQLRLGPPISLITTKRRTTCALDVAGRAWCWGSQPLGTGSSGSSFGPVPVSGGLRFSAISVGGYHTCAVATDGAPWCWGYDTRGELGNGPPLQISWLPTPVSGGLSFDAISSGDESTCGLTGSAAPQCWGRNVEGQLGDGTTTDRLVPVPVVGDPGWDAVVISGGRFHTCAVASDDSAWCWGYNFYAQLGDGTFTNSSRPMPVFGGASFKAISAGWEHTCGVTTSGAVLCWGRNNVGQLGNGTTMDKPIPWAVSGGLNLVAISSGGSHTCGVATNGAAWCWGANGSGQLGGGTADVRSLVPVPVSGGLSFTQITAGYTHTCGVDTTGHAWCWGDNINGQLGDGTATDSPVPVRPQWYLQ